ncbi:MAG: DUF4275 family protein [Solibacillus sp.]
MDNLIEQLQSNNIKFQDIPYWGIYFRKRWEEAFVSHLKQTEKEKIYLFGSRYSCGYLWHVFSYDKRPYLLQTAANDAFDTVKKSKCYIFYQHSANVLTVEHASTLKAAQFANEEDVYVVDENFTWTYVVTHESYCGPYFSKVDSY